MAPLSGLHHVTAITGDAPRNLDFYTRVLGLRLVKKTVNQDDVSAYHLFYADAAGSPGTDVTFFDWPLTPADQHGAGSIAPIGLRVNGSDSIAWWLDRLDSFEVRHGEPFERGGRPVLGFEDPEGQKLELAADGGRPGGQPWDGGGVPAEHAIKGLDSVGITVAQRDPTVAVLTQVMGFTETSPGVFSTGEGGPGAEVRLAEGAGRAARPGRGGVHHVAYRVADDDEHRAWRERIANAGLSVTPVIDRFYFKSIYFREPGGALFEIATDGPGFSAD
jgi:glyoxalase family protein